jgi:hypothetical protein
MASSNIPLCCLGSLNQVPARFALIIWLRSSFFILLWVSGEDGWKRLKMGRVDLYAPFCSEFGSNSFRAGQKRLTDVI